MLLAMAPWSVVSAQVAGEQATPGAADTDSLGLEEIIVTAQRRSENLQDAPLAIDVISADALSNTATTNLQEMSRLAPSLQAGRAGGPYALFFIRGVGSFAANSLTDAAIAVSLDDVPLARQYATGGQFYDLQRVEVLKGPQGTLYGRNATGGAINIIPNRPEFEYAARVAATVGNHGHRQFSGMLNTPLTDASALRLAAQAIQHDGYLSDGQDDEDSKAARLQYRIDGGSLSLTLSGDYFHQGGRGGGNALLSGGYTADQRVGLADPRARQYYQSIGRVPPQTSDLFIDGDYGGLKAALIWTSDLGELTVIPAYRKAEFSSRSITGALLIDDEDDEQQSFETRFAFNKIGGLNLILGGFYLEDSVTARFEVDNLAANRTLPAAGNIQDFEQDTETYAFFGDATLSLTDVFRLIGGVRYTEETKSLDGTLTTYATFVPPLPIDRSRSWQSTDWRAGLQWDVTDSSMLYATVSTGFHSGGFFFTHDDPTYQPETLMAYTLGSKNRLLDNRLQANFEVFLWEYDDQQLSGVSVDSAGSTIFATVNAASSTIKGAEVELEYLLAHGTRLGLQGQYLDSEFDEFRFFQPFPAPAISACRSSFVAAGRFRVDCSGLRPPQAPEWTVNVGIEQSFVFGGGSSLVADVRGHYQTESYMATNYLPSDVQDAYTRGDASLTYYAAGDSWSLAAFVNNFTDEAIKNSANHPNVDSAQLRAPRFYGIRADVRF